MGFFLDGKQNYVLFHFYIRGKLCKYSTRISVERKDWDLKLQRPKARRGDIGEANRIITHELNEYQKVFDDLKRYYKEILTKEIVKKKFDEHFRFKITSSKKTYSDYFQIYIQQKKDSHSLQKDSWQKYTRIHTAILELEKKNNTTYYLPDFNSFFSMN